MLLCAPLLALPGVSAARPSASESKKATDLFFELKERKRLRDAIDMRFLGGWSKEGLAVSEAKKALIAVGETAVHLIDGELRQKLDRDWIDVLEGIGKPGVPILAKYARNGKAMVIPALYRLGPKARAAIPALVDIMDDKTVAKKAADAIEHIGTPEPEAVSALLEFAKDEKHPFRQGWATTLLGRMGRDAQCAVGELAEVLKRTDDPDLERTIIYAIGKSGGKDAVAVLKKRLSSEEQLAMIVEALGETGDESALPLLTDQLFRRDNHVYTAMPAFKNFGEEALPYLLPYLDSDSPDTRNLAVRAIRRLKHLNSAMPHLCRALSDSRQSVRVIAAIGLGKIGPGARSCLPDLLKMMYTEECPAVPLAQVARDDSEAAKRAVAALTAVLKNRERQWRDRENAATALGILGPRAKSALPLLRRTVAEIENPYSCIRVAAKEAIFQIDVLAATGNVNKGLDSAAE